MKMYCYLQEGINPVTELNEYLTVEYLRNHKPKSVMLVFQEW